MSQVATQPVDAKTVSPKVAEVNLPAKNGTAKYVPMYPVQFSTEAQLTRFQSVVKENPLKIEDIGAIVEPLIVDGADLGHYVTLGSLIDSAANDPVRQRTIDEKRVAKVIYGDSVNGIPGLIFNRKIIVPIKVGYHPQEDGTLSKDVFSISSGRHRLTAILTFAKASGQDINSPEFRSQKIRVTPDVYSVEGVMAENATRTARKSERTTIALQKLGVDPSDAQSMISAYANKTIPAGKVGLLFAGMFMFLLAKMDEEGKLPLDLAALSPETIAEIAASIPAAFKKISEHCKRGLSNAEYTQRVISFAWVALPDAVKAVREVGVTNVAYNKSAVVSAVIKALNSVVGTDKLPNPPVAEKKTSEGGEAKPSRKSKKSAAAVAK